VLSPPITDSAGKDSFNKKNQLGVEKIQSVIKDKEDISSIDKFSQSNDEVEEE